MHTHTHTHTVLMVRRQKELITPLLFEVAHSGNKDLLFKILENGDDVNPTVREIPKLIHVPYTQHLKPSIIDT